MLNLPSGRAQAPMDDLDDVVVLHAAGLDAGMADWLDVPGARGLSMLDGLGSQEFGLGDLARGVAERLDGPANVVGCSLGSMVAMHLAIGHPHLVRSLVLMCAPSHAPRDVLEERARETARRTASAMVDDTLARWFSPDFLSRRSAQLDYARHRLETVSTDEMSQTWRAIAAHDVRSGLAGLGVPVTCLAGVDDRSVSPDAVRELAGAIPHSRFEMVSGGHVLPLDVPDSVSQAIRRHLEWARESA